MFTQSQLWPFWSPRLPCYNFFSPLGIAKSRSPTDGALGDCLCEELTLCSLIDFWLTPWFQCLLWDSGRLDTTVFQGSLPSCAPPTHCSNTSWSVTVYICLYQQLWTSVASTFMSVQQFVLQPEPSLTNAATGPNVWVRTWWPDIQECSAVLVVRKWWKPGFEVESEFTVLQ